MSEEHIEVDVQGYERSPIGYYWDDNWLNVVIRVRAGGFRGKVAASIIASELAEFLSELRRLFDALNGEAHFETLEGQLSLRLTGDGLGHIELRGEVMDKPGIGNRLRFSLKFDQTFLVASIRDLERVTAQFPPR